ncbi:protein MAIN-LIKE 2 [Tripterygium wilfordii]|uniref:protein MAIN-LIKE 2 n=1 Tax=Tripterygium wilfordii TaxID=458696 RepID=UPI0018F857A4|nr:protein MAIN-LIKE 2 [Tripterygium wilfordii]XP_038703729.1 protein MAIN-LIKE 2 [Tripterygium wilfordii]XP_038703730.1 protein MAIN-LIKE 2 [Tripterygium wilfordii]
MDPSATNPGPIESSVLYDQDKHVSSAVWEGQERGALRCHEHTLKLGEWRLTPKQIELVEEAGFGYLRKIPAISLDNPLISALVERWRRETNTFHLTVGEMTVSLQDVALLLGLAIDGKPVIGITYTTCSFVCERLLGRSPDSSYASGGMVKLSWLKEYFSQCPEDAPIEEVEQCTRAYLLYLVGSTIFSTTTGNKVPVMYLPLFENFEEAGKYAWGAAALAFLYRALGNASVKSQSTICGCLTLLQCWGYFHLNIGRPKLNRDPSHDHFPFVLRWKGKQSGPTTNRDVVFYRKALDSLKPCDVEWRPYKYMDSTVIPEDIKSTLILGRSKTMLICFDKAERHLPDRCLRQYGMMQPIPEDVKRWVRKSRGVDGGVDLSGKMESELDEWFHRANNIVNGDDADDGEYMHWYLRITRRIVGRPVSLSSEFQRMISGLREISYLADSFATKGLDPQQFESISRIRFISQECLRDQTGSPITSSAAPQIEAGKRVRGKERVRRKSSGKRRRKDDQMEFPEASDDQSQFCSPVIEVDQFQLRQVDGEIGELQICTDGEFEPLQPSHAAGVGNNAELCDVSHKFDDSPLCDADDGHRSAFLSDAVKKVDDMQLGNETNEVNTSQLCYMETKEVDDFQPHDVTNGVNGEQFCDPITTEMDYSQPGDAAVNDPQLHNVIEAKDSQLYDPTNNVDESLSHLADESEPTTTQPAVEVPELSLENMEDVVQQEDKSIIV